MRFIEWLTYPNTVAYVRDSEPLVTRGWLPLRKGYDPGDGPSPWRDLAISNINTEELAVYLGMAWQLIRGGAAFGIAVHHSTWLDPSIDATAKLIAWEHLLDPKGPPSTAQVRGWTPAHSSVPIRTDQRTSRDELLKDKSLLVPLRDFHDLVELYRISEGDVYAEINLLSVRHDQAAVVDLLRSPDAPRMADLLQHCDCFIDLVVPEDLGFNDVLMVSGHSGILERVTSLASQYDAAIQRYEGRIASAQTPAEATTLMLQLALPAGAG